MSFHTHTLNPRTPGYHHAQRINSSPINLVQQNNSRRLFPSPGIHGTIRIVKERVFLWQFFHGHLPYPLAMALRDKDGYRIRPSPSRMPIPYSANHDSPDFRKTFLQPSFLRKALPSPGCSCSFEFRTYSSPSPPQFLSELLWKPLPYPSIYAPKIAYALAKHNQIHQGNPCHLFFRHASGKNGETITWAI